MKLAQSAVEQKKAACASVSPVFTSIFRWNNKICKEKEAQIFFKAADHKLAELIAFVEKNHPYDVPEIISFTSDITGEKYEKWLNEN
ncbi:MAG: hypothetical protein A2096_09120 [Spirochaetes bacterium GWF1_41_5]|nr:MAG: hypothetical protein A2096_09120 [Spirochaetes bacterium GWF1_41_5]